MCSEVGMMMSGNRGHSFYLEDRVFTAIPDSFFFLQIHLFGKIGIIL